MAKPLFQDIVPPDRRSITHVPVPNRTIRRNERTDHPQSAPVASESRSAKSSARHLRVADDEPQGAEILTPAPEETIRRRALTPEPPERIEVRGREPQTMRRVPFYEERDPYRPRFPWKACIVFLCAIAIIGGTYVVLSHYAKATVIVTPRTESLSLNDQFNGTPINASSTNTTSSTEKIPFSVITATKDGAMTVSSTGQTTTQTKATGQIIIFNSYSTSPQKLIAGTRFSTPDGLIFRITAATTIPGKSGTVPGSATANVIADKAGSQYNINLSDFAIPGLSGTSAYTGMYARSKTAMTGGFSGIQPQVDAGTLAAAQATIDAELEGSLLQGASQQVLPGDILLPNAYVVSYTHLPTTAASSSEAVVKEEGTIHAFIFDSTQLAQAFAATNQQGTSSTSAATIWQLTDVSGLSFSITAASSTNSEF